MNASAIVLASGWYRDVHAKVAHGLVRSSSRFDVVGVVDADCAGQDAGEVLDGVHRDVPVFASQAEAIAGARRPVEVAVVGIATHGGRITDEVRAWVMEAIGHGLSVVNGLHDGLGDSPRIARAAAEAGVELTDIRRVHPRHELHFWTGAIAGVRAPRIAVLGTDCALGKRTTTRALVEALVAAGVRAEMIYTGQTGWLQGARYGFIFDSTLNDYVSGELEHALVTCDREASPDVMLIEGQSSLRNPCGPCGAELLLSGAAAGVILQHAPGRRYFEGYDERELEIPPLEDEIELIARYGSRVLAVVLNGEGLDDAGLRERQAALRESLGLPVVRLLEEGPAELVRVVRRFLEEPHS